MNLKNFESKLALACGLLLISFGAQAQVVGSLHDLSPLSAANDQTCVFCHTPHGADTSATVPLWNKAILSPQTYQRYSDLNTATFDSEEGTIAGSASLACLSCHDGSQARDVVINAPGSGGYTPGGAALDGGISALTGSPIPMLGLDLRDDHPIAMQYAAGGALTGDPPGLFTGTLGDPDFNAPVLTVLNGNEMWWVDANGVGTPLVREKTDMILYSRDIGNTLEPMVECGSCHDPHNSTTGLTAGNVAFQRMTNDQSRICTSCHVK